MEKEKIVIGGYYKLNPNAGGNDLVYKITKMNKEIITWRAYDKKGLMTAFQGSCSLRQFAIWAKERVVPYDYIS